MTDADVVVIGGGAAAVSAAWPLVRAGLRVLMLDQGRRSDATTDLPARFPDGKLSDPAAWKTLLGADFTGLAETGRKTPKMKIPAHQYVMRGFSAAYRLKANGVHALGSLARGGLTVMWGAGAYPYAAAETAHWPVDFAELCDSYREIATRIGICGSADDDLAAALGPAHPLQAALPAHPTAALMLDTYRRRHPQDFILGRARNAVLTRPQDGRQDCDQTGLCLWGCPRGAIYRADQDIDLLSRHDNFRYQDCAFVTAVTQQDGHWVATARDMDGRQPERRFSGRRLILAAGTIGTTALVLRYFGIFDRPLPLACHPAFAFAALRPSRIGSAWQSRHFALGQLAYQIGPAGQPDAFGSVFSCEGLLASDVIRAFPFTRRNAAVIGRALLPAILVANGYLPSRYSDSNIRLTSDGELEIRGGFSVDYEAALTSARRRIARGFRRSGMLPLPGSFQRAQLGSDSHYAGTLPMTAVPGSQAPGCDPNGQVYDAPGLYVADGAALPEMPAKHPTFTIMANADRISRRLAATFW